MECEKNQVLPYCFSKWYNTVIEFYEKEKQSI